VPLTAWVHRFPKSRFIVTTFSHYSRDPLSVLKEVTPPHRTHTPIRTHPRTRTHAPTHTHTPPTRGTYAPTHHPLNFKHIRYLLGAIDCVGSPISEISFYCDDVFTLLARSTLRVERGDPPRTAPTHPYARTHAPAHTHQPTLTHPHPHAPTFNYPPTHTHSPTYTHVPFQRYCDCRRDRRLCQLVYYFRST
jgi:hypothetical protein